MVSAFSVQLTMHYHVYHKIASAIMLAPSLLHFILLGNSDVPEFFAFFACGTYQHASHENHALTDEYSIRTELKWSQTSELVLPI
uniref:Secreted protein n=1 Tax=Steinernema glaseri TaxID=37863 RepID=A0A1I7Z278_9BILA